MLHLVAMIGKNTLALLFAFALGLAGCSKKADDPTPTTPPLSAKTTLLITPKWRITAIVGALTFGGQTTTTDSYANLPTCRRDDFSKFSADLTVAQDEGATRCTQTDPQTRAGTWSFNAAETQLTVIDPSKPVGTTGQTVTADLLQLTSTTLVVKTTTTQTTSGITIVTTATTTYAAF